MDEKRIDEMIKNNEWLLLDDMMKLMKGFLTDGIEEYLTFTRPYITKIIEDDIVNEAIINGRDLDNYYGSKKVTGIPKEDKENSIVLHAWDDIFNNKDNLEIREKLISDEDSKFYKNGREPIIMTRKYADALIREIERKQYPIRDLEYIELKTHTKKEFNQLCKGMASNDLIIESVFSDFKKRICCYVNNMNKWKSVEYGRYERINRVIGMYLDNGGHISDLLDSNNVEMLRDNYAFLFKSIDINDIYKNIDKAKLKMLDQKNCTDINCTTMRSKEEYILKKLKPKILKERAKIIECQNFRHSIKEKMHNSLLNKSNIPMISEILDNLNI